MLPAARLAPHLSVGVRKETAHGGILVRWSGNAGRVHSRGQRAGRTMRKQTGFLWVERIGPTDRVQGLILRRIEGCLPAGGIGIDYTVTVRSVSPETIMAFLF